MGVVCHFDTTPDTTGPVDPAPAPEESVEGSNGGSISDDPIDEYHQLTNHPRKCPSFEMTVSNMFQMHHKHINKNRTTTR